MRGGHFDRTTQDVGNILFLEHVVRRRGAGRVIQRVLDTLSSYPGGSVMTQHWRQGETLKVVRREPYQTASAKILPLHLQRSTAHTDHITERTRERATTS